MHNEELMLELALNKSKGTGVGNSTSGQQATNFEDYNLPATMAPPPQLTTYTLTTYSNALPTTSLTSDFTSIRKGKQSCCCCCNQYRKMDWIDIWLVQI